MTDGSAPSSRTPSVHHPSLSRRSSVSASHPTLSNYGPGHNVDTTQIGKPVTTPRQERPGHKRSLTGMSYLSHVGLVEEHQQSGVELVVTLIRNCGS